MPTHYARNEKKQIDIVKENKNLKESAITGLSPRMSKKLREHSKLHAGGMASAHVKIMLKHLRNKKSFNTAHSLAVKEEEENKKK